MENTKGIMFMVISMAAFAIEDMFIKAAAEAASIGLILVLFGLGGMAIFVCLTWWKGEAVFHPAMVSRPILLRAGCEVVGRLFFVLAITLTALSTASAVLQATPLVVVVCAALFFRERVGLAHWLAILLGFFGVLMIIRPGIDGFEASSWFAVIATLGFAGRDLATRAAPPVLSNRQLGVYGFFVLIPTGLALLIHGDNTIEIDWLTGGQIVAATLFGVIAYYALTVAMRTGELSVVSPFRYTRLLFALCLGILVFGERPDPMTLLGSLLIIVSGGYILIQNRRKPT